MQWPPKSQADLPSELTECISNWKAAEAEPETVSALLEKEIANGWVIRTNMSIEQARQHWHKGIAVGKLNVVHAEGKDPRLVLDSTVCGVNPKCAIPERISLPMASDVRLAFLPEDTRSSFVGASFDFKAAHKQIQAVNMACFCFGLPMSCTIIECATSEHASPHTGGNAPEHSS